MQLKIDDNQSIADIQAVFARNFPYLKLEFFSIHHESGQGTAGKYLIIPTKHIGQCRTNQHTGTIFITPGMTVEKLEKEFRNVYGLAVQVFRKSGNVWLETTVTDSWTLQKQNKQGEELSEMHQKKQQPKSAVRK
jgi:hypothetical protein